MIASAGAALLSPAVAFADPDPLDPKRLPPPFIYNYGENETTRSAAMGGALRALGNGTSALFLNPANMVETRLYHIEAFAQVTPETGRQVYGGSVVDSVTGRLAGGVSVTGAFMDPDGLDRALLDVRVALAYPISDRLFLGVGGRYLKVSQTAHNPPFGTHDPIAGGLVDADGTRFAFVNAMSFDAGLTVKAGDNFYIGAVGQNLTYRNNSLLPTTVGGGLGFGNDTLSIEVDGLADLTSYSKPKARAMAGGELLVADHVPIRLGYRYDQGANIHSLSAGLGYIDTQFSAEASVRRTLSEPGATSLVFSLAYFLESSGLTRTSAADLD